MGNLCLCENGPINKLEQQIKIQSCLLIPKKHKSFQEKQQREHLTEETLIQTQESPKNKDFRKSNLFDYELRLEQIKTKYQKIRQRVKQRSFDPIISFIPESKIQKDPKNQLEQMNENQFLYSDMNNNKSKDDQFIVQSNTEYLFDGNITDQEIPTEQKLSIFSNNHTEQNIFMKQQEGILEIKQLSSQQLKKYNKIYTGPQKEAKQFGKQNNLIGQLILKQQEENKLANYLILGYIARGQLSKVYKAKRKGCDKEYALKIVKKADLKRYNLQENKFIDNHILSSCPFLVKIKKTFEIEQKIVFIEEFVPGITLDQYIKKKNQLLSEQVKFIAAQIVLALEYIHHEIKIVYLDLRPENIIIQNNGYLKLTDIGLTRTFHFEEVEYLKKINQCDHLAPEIMESNREISSSADWWSLGVLISKLGIGEDTTKGLISKLLQEDFQKRISRLQINLILLSRYQLNQRELLFQRDRLGVIVQLKNNLPIALK